MEWVERLNNSIKYIEEHLMDEIDYEKLARTAGCSSYHYQRMFVYMAGIPLRNLKGVFIRNGCPLRDMNTGTLPMWRSILIRILQIQNLKCGCL